MSLPSSPENVSRIHVLPDALANQIAAGEVVERPASVVKELLENSIDAGARLIRVEVEGGGKKLIRVTDDGSGMGPEDAELSFCRHATSKIRAPEDLVAIRSLGFRGEALPSIASIARVRLSTSADEHQGGRLVVYEGGAPGMVKDIAFPRGTSIEVAQLFFNTPARKKFLKSDGTEFSHIVQVVTQQALVFPHIHFTLVHNGKEVLNTLPTEHRLYRIAELFGAELARELVEVNARAGDYGLTGYVSSPVFSRSNRGSQYTFVNGRMVRDKVILHATQQGYSHLLPKGQHPVLFLLLEMDPHLLDVNVHPAKAEVRFAFQQEVHRFVSDAVRNALSAGVKGEEPLSSPETPGMETPPGRSGLGGTPERPEGTSGFPAGTSLDTGREAPGEYSRHQHGDVSRALDLMYGSENRQGPGGAEGGRVPVFELKPLPVASLMYSDFEPVGQLNESFIIMQGLKGILVVDQHIAHERVLYERFRAAARTKKVEVQQLLFPQPLVFSPGETLALEANLDLLKGLGLELEPFGKNEFLLRSVPAILKKGEDYGQLLREVAELAENGGQKRPMEEKYEEILITMACRNAIKINQPLEKDQIRKLISDLEKTEMPYTCPHGRPISLLFEMDEILKRFLRK